MKSRKTRALAIGSQDYDAMLGRVVGLIDEARRTSARTVNAIMTATYWLIGRYIVEFELRGKKRAEYGQELLARLAVDLTGRFGRGFSRQNLQQMRQFYQAFPPGRICQTLSGKSNSGQISQTVSGKSPILSAASIELPRRKSQTLSDQSRKLERSSIESPQSKIQTTSGKFRRHCLRYSSYRGPAQ